MHSVPHSDVCDRLQFYTKRLFLFTVWHHYCISFARNFDLCKKWPDICFYCQFGDMVSNTLWLTILVTNQNLGTFGHER